MIRRPRVLFRLEVARRPMMVCGQKDPIGLRVA